MSTILFCVIAILLWGPLDGLRGLSWYVALIALICVAPSFMMQTWGARGVATILFIMIFIIRDAMSFRDVKYQTTVTFFSIAFSTLYLYFGGFIGSVIGMSILYCVLAGLLRCRFPHEKAERRMMGLLFIVLLFECAVALTFMPIGALYCAIVLSMLLAIALDCGMMGLSGTVQRERVVLHGSVGFACIALVLLMAQWLPF